MARSTVYNEIVTAEKLKEVNSDNRDLLIEFVEYLESIDRSKETIKNYISDIKICFCWSLEYNKNKFFVDFTKRDIMKYQNYLLNTLNLSPNRIRRLRSSISSLSNFIENILDDDYPDFRNIIGKIPAPARAIVRAKTVLENEQLQELLDILVERKDYQKACVLAIAMCSGARKSELLRFKTDYFKDENIIYGALYKTPEKMKTKGRGVNGKLLYRYTLCKEFKPYLDLWMEEREKLGIDSEWLFVKLNEHGTWEQMKVSTLNVWASQFSKLLEVDFYFHSLRHYFTTNLAKYNIPDSVIKDIVGWESLEMVSTYKDIEVDDELGKYFGEDGIKGVETGNISDLAMGVNHVQ